MSKINLYNQKGEKKSDLTLNKEIFDVKSNKDLINQAIISQLSNARYNIAHSKIRSEVRGGGKKPWKQKGTGNARAGSSRSPLWIGGGVTFGPRNNKNFIKKLSKKMRQKSIFMALSDKISDNKLIVIDKIDFNDIKTKNANNLLNKLPIEDGSILFILEKSNKNVELSFRNINFTKTLFANNLNIYDITYYDYIVTTPNAISKIEECFLGKSTVKEVKEIKKASKEDKPENKPVKAKK